MRTKNLVFSVFTLLLFVSYANAQVTGVVADDFGPVAGALVTVEESGASTETNEDGAFSIDAVIGNSLIIMNPETLAEKTYPIAKLNMGKLVITDATVALDDVITLGYSTTTDEAYTGSADVVDSEAISKKSVSNISQALAGESAGVRVVTSSGQPGSVSTIRIRGIGSVNGNTSPLYVVDGVPFDGPLVSINPSDIESTVILKDATATAIYGARGANGVIVINTKKGRKGRSDITYETKTGFNFSLIPRQDVIKSPEAYLEASWLSLKGQAALNGNANPGEWASNNLFGSSAGLNNIWNLWNADGDKLIDPSTGKFLPGVGRKYTPEDWAEEAFNPGVRQEHNLSFRTGTEKTSVYSSFGYLNDIGYSINSDYERLSTRLNVNHEITPWLNSVVNLGYSYSDQNLGGQSNDSGSVFWVADNMPSIYPLYERDAEGNIIMDNRLGIPVYDYGFDSTRPRRFAGNTNAIGDATLNTRNNKRHDVNTNISFTADLTDHLSFQTRFGSQYFASNYDYINNPYYGRGANTGGFLFKRKSNQFGYNMLEMLRYENSFGIHNIELLAAHENTYNKYENMSGSKETIVLDGVPELDNALKYSGLNSFNLTYALESYFAQANYNIDKKYYLSATVRRDGSSRFKNNKWGTFGSVGASWIVSRESFLSGNKTLPYLKLKASYGLTGEQSKADTGSQYDDTKAYYTGSNLYELNNLLGEFSYTFNWRGSPNLTWETSKMLQAGIEFSLWNRIDLSVDYYNKNTDDLLFERRVAPSLGYAMRTVNDGELLNSGIEFNLKTDIVKNDNLNIYFNVNGEIIKNELLKMPIDPTTGKPKALDIQGLYGRSAGHSIYDYYMTEWHGVNSETGAAQWTQHFVDVNGDGVYTPGEDETVRSLTDFIIENPDKASKIIEGITEDYSLATAKYVGKSAIPDVRGAFNLGADYKNFSVSVQLLYSLGGYSFDQAYQALMHNGQIGGNNWHKDIFNAWQNPGDVTDVPRLSNNAGTDGRFNSSSTRFLTKSDYLTINNVRVGYTFPSRWIERTGLAELGMFVQGDNLWLFSERRGFNPSTSITGGSNYYRYSPLSSVTFGLRVKL